MIYFMSLRKFLNLAICCYNILVMEFLGCYSTLGKERTLLAHKALWDELKERRSREEEAREEEDEPEETHCDKGTQTEDEILEQDLPLKKRRIQLEEESP
jgi:hypothetical protein